MGNFTFNKSNLSKYVITYPHFNMSYIVTLELEKLQKAVKKITGEAMRMIPDDKREHTYEIVVDAAAREGAATPGDYDAYIIAPVGTKLFVKGGRPYSTAAAVKRLCRLLKAGKPLTGPVNGSYESDVKGFGSDYRLTWGDDFDGDEIDTTKWDIFHGRKGCYGGTLNGKTAYRCREDKPNTFVKDGSLYICADQTETAYYGGMLCTHGIMRYKHGFIEISTIHPKGIGFWTALWMNSDPGPGGYHSEVDVEECYGNGGDYVLGNTFAWPNKEMREAGYEFVHTNNRRRADTDGGFFTDYHTFGFEWNENDVVFTCDGFPYVRQNLSQNEHEVDAFSMPMYLRLSMACGFDARGAITDDPEEWANTNKYIVDYVNIYQKPGQELIYYRDGEEDRKIII